MNPRYRFGYALTPGNYFLGYFRYEETIDYDLWFFNHGGNRWLYIANQAGNYGPWDLSNCIPTEGSGVWYYAYKLYEAILNDRSISKNVKRDWL